MSSILQHSSIPVPFRNAQISITFYGLTDRTTLLSAPNMSILYGRRRYFNTKCAAHTKRCPTSYLEVHHTSLSELEVLSIFFDQLYRTIVHQTAVVCLVFDQHPGEPYVWIPCPTALLRKIIRRHPIIENLICLGFIDLYPYCSRNDPAWVTIAGLVLGETCLFG